MQPAPEKHITRVYRNIPKWLPMVLSGECCGGLAPSMNKEDPKEVWVHNKKMSDDRICRIEASGAVKPSTIFTLLAAVASIQNNVGEISLEKTTITLVINDAKRWMLEYLGHNNHVEVSKDVRRLITYRIFWVSSNGDFSTHAYVYDGELKKNRLTIVLKRAFVELCMQEGLRIEFMAMQKELRRKPVAKLLYMYLCSNSATEFCEETLIERVGLTNGIRDNRRTLKKAFTNLLGKEEDGMVKEGFIASFNYDEVGRKFSYVENPKEIKV